MRVYENSEVLDVQSSENGVTLNTSYGYKVKGKIVIVATGYDTHLFSKRVFGTKTTTFNIATRPINDLEDVYKGVIVRDNEDPYNYSKKPRPVTFQS